MWRDLGISLVLYLTHLLASFILLRKFALILPGTLSSSQKKAAKACTYKFNQNNAQVFMINPCFLRMDLNVTWNVVNSFWRRHEFVEKTCVLFCQFGFVYFLETTMYECSLIARSFDSEVMPGTSLLDFIRPKQNLSRQ